MKKFAYLLLLCLLLSLVPGCRREEKVSITGKVIEVEKYGHAKLDITTDTFSDAGFELGDIVTVKAGSFEGDMPYFNGYYVESGEYMVRGFPGKENIAVCINYGRFAETFGIDVGDEVTIVLKEKAGALSTQEFNNLVYSDSRTDYESDEVFSNFRAIRAGGIGDGKLYRSASPVNNEHNRAATTGRLIEEAGIKAVINVADTEEDVLAHAAQADLDSTYYMNLFRNGHVITLGLAIDYASDDFAESIAKGLTFLSEQEPPFLVHCTEGKDRAGFCVMILEALMGASEEEITADYLISYENYYHLDPVKDAGLLETIAEINVREMLRTMAGLEKGADLTGVDLAAAAEKYLTIHGMEAGAIETLKEKLQ